MGGRHPVTKHFSERFANHVMHPGIEVVELPEAARQVEILTNVAKRGARLSPFVLAR
jgi:hypothetical protein